MIAVASTGPGQSQEFHLAVLCACQRPKHLDHITLQRFGVGVYATRTQTVAHEDDNIAVVALPTVPHHRSNPMSGV